MATEIEHKYIVVNESYKSEAYTCLHIVQGYLSKDPERTVRIRIYDNRGFLTVKGHTDGDSRLEFEYEIPLEDAKKMMSLCQGVPLEKKRWLVLYKGHKWEVDEYINRDFPTVAEIELESSHLDYALPDFVGKNVTGDPAYYNSNI